MRISLRMMHASRSGTDKLDEKKLAFPEQHLMLAVLEDAIACYMDHLKPRTHSGKTLFDAAEHWFFHESGDWIFSFANICETVGLDTDYVRQGLREAKQRKLRRQPLTLREVRHGHVAHS